MSTRIKLKEFLELLFTRLLGGVLAVVLGLFLLFSLLFADYRASTNAALLFEKNLFDIQQQTHLINLDVETLRFGVKSATSQKIKQNWQRVMAKIATLQQSNDQIEMHNLVALMRQLQARHQRVVDIVQFDLDKPDEKLFNQKVLPTHTKIFTLLTQLVEISANENNLPLVKISADLRGYFTQSQGTLSEIVRKNPAYSWNDFNLIMQSVNNNLTAAGRVSNLPAEYKTSLQSLQIELNKFIHNVKSSRQLTTNVSYYDLDAHSLHINNLSKKIDNEATKLNEEHFNLLGKSEQRLWTMFGLFLLLTLAMLLLAVRLLKGWKVNFIKLISNPITAISSQSRRIATGDTNLVLKTESHIEEITELVATIDEIKSIVAIEAEQTKLRQKVHHFKEQINQFQYQATNLESLVNLSLAQVVKFSNALAAACYLKTDTEESLPTLINTYNKSSSSLKIGQQMDAALLQQASKSGEIAFYDLVDEKYNVDSALVALRPKHLCIYPILDNTKLVGVLELVLPEIGKDEQNRLYEILERFSIVVVSRLNLNHTEQLLDVTQEQKLKLKEAMDEMRQQHAALQHSETELEVQADELKLANSQLKKQNEEAEENQNRLSELNVTLKKTSQELKKASELKSQFLSKVSHELRTPLNSIIILIQTLLRKPDDLDAQQLTSLEVVQDSSQDLLELINDLLDMARIEAGEIKVHFDQYTITDVIHRLESLFTPIAEQKQLKFVVTKNADIPQYIYSDIQRLQQVLKNLLSNAFKFTQKGQISLDVSSDSEWLTFTVTDTGIGIADDAQSSIFEAFNQVDNTSVSAREGTGLGLSISSQLAEVLGGRIEMHSEFGKGSRFSFSIPNNQSTLEAEDSNLARPAVSASQPSAKITSTSAQQPQSTIQASWHVIGAPPEVWDTLAKHKKIGPQVRQKPWSELSNITQASDKCCGIILFLSDEIIRHLDDKVVQKQLESMTDIKSVIISFENSPPLAPWLAAMANLSLQWNNALVEQLDTLINHQQLQSSEQTPAITDAQAVDFVFSQSQRILIVEDDMRSLFAMSQLMKKYGLDTELADNLTLANEKIKNQHFDLVITDLVLPDGDGLEFIRTLRSDSHFAELPIFVLSAKNLQEEKDKCEALRARYFDKPIDTEQLLANIYRVLESNND